MRIKNTVKMIGAYIGAAFALGFVSGFITMLIFSKTMAPYPPVQADNQEQQMEQPKHQEKLPSEYAVNGINWEDAKKGKKPVAIAFFVDWCGYCRKFAPVLDGIREEYKSKYNFVFINCDERSPETQQLMSDFNINSFPSFFLVDTKNDRKEYVEPSDYHNVDLLKSKLDSFSKK